MSLSLGEKKVSNFNIASLFCNDPALASRYHLLHYLEGVIKGLGLWLTALKAQGILSG